MPPASLWKPLPAGPNCLIRNLCGIDANWPMVCTPRSASLFSIFSPTPQSSLAGIGAINSRSLPGSTSRILAGRAAYEAALATNLLTPIPADISKPSISFTFCFISAAMCLAVPNRLPQALTSRYALSSPSGSSKGVYTEAISITAAWISRYS